MSATTPTEHAAVAAPQARYILPGQMAWTIYELAYRTKAALELLHTFESIAEHDSLTGVGYLLQNLAHDINAAADVIGNGERGAA